MHSDCHTVTSISTHALFTPLVHAHKRALCFIDNKRHIDVCSSAASCQYIIFDGTGKFWLAGLAFRNKTTCVNKALHPWVLSADRFTIYRLCSFWCIYSRSMLLLTSEHPWLLIFWIQICTSMSITRNFVLLCAASRFPSRQDTSPSLTILLQAIAEPGLFSHHEHQAFWLDLHHNGFNEWQTVIMSWGDSSLCLGNWFNQGYP